MFLGHRPTLSKNLFTTVSPWSPQSAWGEVTMLFSNLPNCDVKLGEEDKLLLANFCWPFTAAKIALFSANKTVFLSADLRFIAMFYPLSIIVQEWKRKGKNPRRHHVGLLCNVAIL